MKRNVLMGLMVATMSFANVSYANFIFHSNVSNACENVSGSWSGTGKASNWFVGECVYHGSGNVSRVDSTGSFKIDVSADKDSGSFLCPNHATEQLKGVCVNGAVTILTDFGNLTGNFSPNEGSANGVLSVSPGMDAEVSIQFRRVG